MIQILTPLDWLKSREPTSQELNPVLHRVYLIMNAKLLLRNTGVHHTRM